MSLILSFCFLVEKKGCEIRTEERQLSRIFAAGAYHYEDIAGMEITSQSGWP